MTNVFFISLGCDKNLVDSELMLGLLQKKGYGITDKEDKADVIVINTCCFIHDAKEESIETIIEMGKLKGDSKVLIVAGCLGQRYREEIKKELPEVDAIIGTTAYDEIVSVIEKCLDGKQEDSFKDVNYLPMDLNKRIYTTGTHTAYLKIAEGCDKHCTYCIIPKVRGNFRSMPMEDLKKQAEDAAQAGIKELIIVAQETTIYGMDLYGEKALPKLLTMLAKIEGIEWIRLMYCYPEEITDELIQTIASEPKICHYIDMPIQHSEDTILRHMGRRTTKKEIKQVLDKLYHAIPDMAVRTSLISGFPGETQKEHNALLDFLDEMEFRRLGVFTYSREEGTPAAGYENQVPEDVAQKRKQELMELQQEISYATNKEMLGSELTVMVEGYLYEEDIYIGRSYMDAPDIDGNIFIHSENELISGDMVKVRITKADIYDLAGEEILT